MEFTVLWKFPKGNFEVRLGAVGARFSEDLGAWNRRSKCKSVRENLVGPSLGVAFVASHAGEHRVFDPVEVPPCSDGVVALVALDKTKLSLHTKQLERKGFGQVRFGDYKIRIGQEVIVGPEDQRFGRRVRVDRLAQVHSKELDCRRTLWVDQGRFERLFGDLKIGLQLQRVHHQRRGLVGKPVARDRIGW